MNLYRLLVFPRRIFVQYKAKVIANVRPSSKMIKTSPLTGGLKIRKNVTFSRPNFYMLQDWITSLENDQVNLLYGKLEMFCFHWFGRIKVIRLPDMSRKLCFCVEVSLPKKQYKFKLFYCIKVRNDDFESLFYCCYLPYCD